MRPEIELTQKELQEILDAMLDVLSDALERGDTVTLSGLGSLYVKTRSGKMLYVPSKKARIAVPPRKTVAFRQSKKLRIK